MAMAAPMHAFPSSTNSTGVWYISWISLWSTWFLTQQSSSALCSSDQFEASFRSLVSKGQLSVVRMISVSLMRQAPLPTILWMPLSLSISGPIIPARFSITPRHTDLVTWPRPMLPWSQNHIYVFFRVAPFLTEMKIFSYSVFVLFLIPRHWIRLWTW